MSIRTVATSIFAAGMLAAVPALAATQAAPTQPPPQAGCPHAGMGHAHGQGMGAQAGGCPNCPHAKGGAPGSPCACAQMSQMANVTITNTPTGATISLNAKDPSQAAAVQQMAQKMSSCMSGMAAPTGQPPPAKK